jgi:hypothetical protein
VLQKDQLLLQNGNEKTSFEWHYSLVPNKCEPLGAEATDFSPVYTPSTKWTHKTYYDSCRIWTKKEKRKYLKSMFSNVCHKGMHS